ncbi:SDR family NAD(P)-dependent oxidoreductase [Vibrio sp.]|nr:SDR family NAD(P)-dependent oxidoreductase [Vibrio sp.]
MTQPRVLITGATSGIGYQLALDYADDDHQVIACGRNQHVLLEMEQSHQNIQGYEVDVTVENSLDKVIDSLDSVPSIWILNAGYCDYVEKGNISVAKAKQLFDVNVFGVINCIETLLKRNSSDVQIVIMGSISSEVPLPRAELYGATKAAISYLARTLQMTLKEHHIHVSIIFPGFVKTPLTDKNTFPMPFIISPEKASVAIRAGVKKRQPYIYLPKRFTWLLRILGCLPYSFQTHIFSRLIK